MKKKVSNSQIPRTGPQKGQEIWERYPGAHARCSVQRAVGIVASFRVLFRK